MLENYPCRDGLYNILPDTVAVYDRYQRRVVTLDALGSEIWLRIDGQTTLRDIATDIAGRSGRPLLDMLRAAIAMAGIMSGEGLIYLTTEPQAHPYHLTVPRADQDPAQTAASMRESGWIEYGA
jgi:hypothetical protein